MKNQWKRFREHVTKLWNEFGQSKPHHTDNYKAATMNIKWNHIAGQWTRFLEPAREQWDALTDDDLIEVNGRFDALSKKIQEKYGIEREEANHQIDMWSASLRI